MTSLFYWQFSGKTDEYNGKKYLIINDAVSNEVLDKFRKIIGIEKFDNFKIVVDKMINHLMILL